MKIALITLLLAASALSQEPPSGVTSACGPRTGSFAVNLDSSQHTQAQPEPGKALVYFIQEKGKDTFSVTTTIGIDGAWVGANKNSSYFSVGRAGRASCVCQRAVLSRASRRARAFHGGGRKGLLLQCAGRLWRRIQLVPVFWRGRQRRGRVSDSALSAQRVDAEEVRRPVCPNPLPFYKIKGLLPSVDSRKQVPSDC